MTLSLHRAFLSIFILVLLGAGCMRSSEPERITIAVSRQPISTPVYVAQDRKFFEREGLQVRLQESWTGKEALDSVMEGKADFATVAETPTLFAFLRNEPVLVVATIGDSDRYMKIVARRDRRIAEAGDLRGKQIGVSPGTNAEYFLDAYLLFNGLSRREVRTVPMKPEIMADALAAGSIDAAVSWDPHAAQQRMKLAKNAVVLENELIYHILWNIAAEKDYVQAHPETVRKLLRGLLKAQDHIAEHGEDALAIMTRYVGANRFSLEDFNFDVRLGQSLVLDLEEQARWAIRNGLTGKREVPNFMAMLYFNGMEAVAPESVTVPHP
jgi:NitT/TauT family transport system substrate-binding protein